MSCLLQLFAMCQVAGCGNAVDPDNIVVTEHGAVIVVQYTCNGSHTRKWCSSPTVGQGKSKVWVLNTVLATYSLTCGLHISQVRKLSFSIFSIFTCIFRSWTISQIFISVCSENPSFTRYRRNFLRRLSG